jgi:hypothetical protein
LNTVRTLIRGPLVLPDVRSCQGRDGSDVREGANMGDKGGKKDKEKNKQQQLKKHQEEAQKKQDKARPKTP